MDKQTKLNNLWNNPTFQKLMDAIRIFLLIMAIIIVVILLININEVKILNSDVCELCRIKTGAYCFYPLP